MGVNDYGRTTDQLSAPVLADWAGSVAAALNGSDVPVDSRIASAITATGDVWQAWTPTVTNMTVSSTTCRYRRTKGGLLTFTALLTVATMGSGGLSFSLPVPTVNQVNGVVWFVDADGGSYVGTFYVGTGSTTCALYATNSAVSWSQVGVPSPTIPFTWAAGDRIAVTGFYQCAPLP